MKNETIMISDDITSSFVEVLHRELDEVMNDGIIDITFDMQKVGVVDSTGIGFIIRIQNSLKRKGGALKLSNVNGDIYRMMKIMRLDKHFLIEK